MKKTSEKFNLKLSFIPMLNLRYEFNMYLHLIDDKDFRNQIADGNQAVDAHYFTWNGMPQPLLTTILQRVILGVEAYIPIATYFELNLRGIFAKDLKQFITNPYSLGGGGTVNNFYDLLPSLVDDRLSLKFSNPSLYGDTKTFYSEIRNPLFHGFQIDSDKPHHLRRSFEHLKKIYRWLDSWHPPHKMLDEIFQKNTDD